MEQTIEVVGNPVTLLIERGAYLGMGIFFIVAIVRGIKR